MIIDFFASLSFYFIPYLTGRFFTKKIVQAWIMGAFIWFILYFLLAEILVLLKIDGFSGLIRFLAIVISTFSLIDFLNSYRVKKPKINLSKDLIHLFLLSFASLVYFLIWKRNTPYPLQLDWDMYEHITLANIISSGNLSFLTTKISDTFTINSYSPFFEILLSLPKIVFQRGLIGIYWWLEYWHFILTVLASFLIAKKFFQDKWIAIFCAIISTLVFESLIAYSSLFLIPQTLVALITVFVFKDIKEYKPFFLLISCLIILLMHYFVGALSLVVLALGFNGSSYRFKSKHLNLGIFIATLIMIIFLALNLKTSWQVLGIEEARHFTFSLWQKIGFLVDWYGISLFIFAVLGYMGILKKGNQYQKLLLIIALLIFGLSLAPFSYFLKLYVLGGYFVDLILALGIWLLIRNLSTVLKVVSLTFLTFVFIITFYKNQLVYKQPLHFKSFETQISFEEIEAGKWLKLHSNGNQFLISDPSLQYVLEAESGVNTQGGAYMSLTTREALMEINGSRDPEFIKSKILSIKDLIPSENKPGRKTLFVVGGRYFAWQMLSRGEKESTFNNIWSPKLIKDEDRAYIDFLSHTKEFKMIYKNDELVIFEVI